MDLLERYNSRVDEKIPRENRLIRDQNVVLDQIRERINEIMKEFIGMPKNHATSMRLLQYIEYGLDMMVKKGEIEDYKISINAELDRLESTFRMLIRFPGRIDSRMLEMRWI